MKEYALYHGDKLLIIGTIEELAKKINVTKSTMYFYTTPSHRRRVKNPDRAYMAIRLDDETED